MARWYQDVLKGFGEAAPSLLGGVGGVFGPVGSAIGTGAGIFARTFVRPAPTVRPDPAKQLQLQQALPFNPYPFPLALPAPAQTPLVFMGDGGGPVSRGGGLSGADFPIWVALGFGGLVVLLVVLRR